MNMSVFIRQRRSNGDINLLSVAYCLICLFLFFFNSVYLSQEVLYITVNTRNNPSGIYVKTAKKDFRQTTRHLGLRLETGKETKQLMPKT